MDENEKVMQPDPRLDEIKEALFHGLLPEEDPWSYPVEKTPCANINTFTRRKCYNTGLYACSGCKVVSYCSKPCQAMHWPSHRPDCRHKMNSKRWKPSWIRDRREPAFAGQPKRKSKGSGLWGNMPAIDILNLPLNESNLFAEDLSLAFIASGDLRNVIETINKIPLVYPGKITCLINDIDEYVTIRNLLILQILGDIRDQALAADIALHFWYSTYLPVEYSQRIQLLSPIGLDYKSRLNYCHYLLQSGARVTCEITGRMLVAWAYITHITQVPFDEDAAAEKRREELFHPDRADYHERYEAMLIPSHRLSVERFRETGILLPFGAATVHFSHFNRSLVDPAGDWQLNDSVSPMDGWSKEAVFASRRKHKAKGEDLLGCYYFYILDQLRDFAARLHKFTIVFHLRGGDCRDLATDLRTASRFVPTSKSPALKSSNTAVRDSVIDLPLQFDRIYVTNAVDDNYVGFERILKDWGPRLNTNNPSATLLTCAMNWAQKQPGGEPKSDPMFDADLMKDMIDKKRVRDNLKTIFSEQWGVPMSMLTTAKPAQYDNSAAFKKYLQSRKVENAASSVGLKLKSKPTLVPFRIGVPLGDPWETIPPFLDQKLWYREVYLSKHNFYERFLEFAVAQK